MRECVREIETQKPHEARESDDEGGRARPPRRLVPQPRPRVRDPPYPHPPNTCKKSIALT